MVFQTLESPAELKKVLDWSERLSNERLVLVNMINNASRDGREDIVLYVEDHNSYNIDQTETVIMM